MLGHDLRNPLGAILASARALELQATADEGIRRIGSRVVSSSRRMGRLLDDMTDLARTRLGQGIPIVREAIDLEPVVSQVVEELRASHPEHRIDVTRGGDLRGTWDSGRISQVISNLVANALLHGRSDEPVELALDGTAPDSVAIRVRNAGRIAAEVLPHVFDPFRGGAAQPGQARGLGLGLYIVQQVVLAHGGRIEVQLPDTDHTVFEAVLPKTPGIGGPARA